MNRELLPSDDEPAVNKLVEAGMVIRLLVYTIGGLMDEKKDKAASI